jgi:RNA polymerase sigma-70 factor (ECF subfamily)
MARWEPILEQVMRERSPRLLAYAVLMTGSDAEAEDVLQDALVRTFSKGRSFDNVNLAEAYVRRAIPSVFIDRLRTRKAAERAHERDVTLHGDGLIADGEHEATESALDVRAALAELPPRERACIVLRFYDDLTIPQIAERLGLAQGTVKRYLADASARLATLLDTEADWETSPETVRVHAPIKEV